MIKLKDKNTQKTQDSSGQFVVQKDESFRRIKNILVEIFYRTLPFAIITIFGILIYDLFVNKGDVFGSVLTFCVAIFFAYPAFKAGYSGRHRKKLIEYHKEQESLPKKDRDSYGMRKSFKFERKMIAIFIIIYIAVFLFLYPFHIHNILNYLTH